MRKDWKMWSLYINANHLYNWGLGFSFYREYNYVPFEMLAAVCQIDLLFFNITLTKWTKGEVFPGV